MEEREGGWCWWPDNRLIRLPVDMVRSKVSGIPAATFSVQPEGEKVKAGTTRGMGQCIRAGACRTCRQLVVFLRAGRSM